MSRQHDITALMAQLSKTEKRYLRMQFSLQGQDKVYLRMWDALAKNPQLTDDDLAARMGIAGSNPRNRVSFYRNYLFRNMLQVLSVYHRDSNSNQEMLHTLSGMEVLFQKGLYAQCRKILRKEKQKCYRAEKFTYLLELIRLEKRMIMAHSYSQISYSDFNTLYKEEQEVLAVARRISSWWRLSNVINKNLFGHEDKRAYPASYFRRILSSAQLNYIPEEEMVLFERSYKYMALSGCHYALGNAAEHYRYISRNVELADHHPQLKDEEINRYLSLHYYLMKAQLGLGLAADVLTVLAKLKQLGKEPRYRDSGNVQSRLLYLQTCFGIRALLKTGDLSAAEKRSAEFDRLLPGSAENLDPDFIAECRYFQALLYYRKGAADQAVQRCRVVLDHPGYDAEKDVYRFARLLLAVLHFRLGNTEVLAYMLRSLQHQYRQIREYYRAEQLLQQLLRAGIGGKRGSMMSGKLSEELGRLRTDVYEKEAFEFFDDFAAIAVSRTMRDQS